MGLPVRTTALCECGMIERFQGSCCIKLLTSVHVKVYTGTKECPRSQKVFNHTSGEQAHGQGEIGRVLVKPLLFSDLQTVHVILRVVLCPSCRASNGLSCSVCTVVLSVERRSHLCSSCLFSTHELAALAVRARLANYATQWGSVKIRFSGITLSTWSKTSISTLPCQLVTRSVVLQSCPSSHP